MMMLNRNRSFVKSVWSRMATQCYKSTANTQIRADPKTPSGKLSSADKLQVDTQKEKLPTKDYANLDNTYIIKRAHSKMPAKSPIAKNFFIASVDTEMLAYPEVLDKDDLDKLITDLGPVSRYFRERSESDGKSDLFKGLKDFKLLSGNVPEEYGGKSFFHTETFLCTEAESNDAGDALAINSHRLVIEAIKEFGTSGQRKEFLEKLGKAELIATTAFWENNGEVLQPKTKAVESNNGFVLNGRKDFIINANKSNYVLVTAETNVKNFIGDSTETISAFLVDLKSPGVIIQPADEKFGCDSIQQHSITFKDVNVSASCVLCESSKGNALLQTLLVLSRLQMGALNITQMKKILNYLVQLSTFNEMADDKLRDLKIIRNVLGKYATYIYGAESMLYLTASIPDLYEKPDIEMESAIIQVYSQKKLLELATTALGYLGTAIVNKGHPIEEAIRDAVQLNALGEPNELLRLYIGSKGLQHAGNFYKTDTKSSRNPLYNPNYAMMQFFRRETVNEPDIKLSLNEFVHPSFDVAAEHLEKSIGRMRVGVKHLLAYEGAKVLENHMSVVRLGESAIEAYALFCGLARASRSYCIGLRYADYDRLFATTLAHEASEKILYMMLEIEYGAVYAYDVHFDKVAEQLVHCGEYFAQHPLTRNF